MAPGLQRCARADGYAPPLAGLNYGSPENQNLLTKRNGPATFIPIDKNMIIYKNSLVEMKVVMVNYCPKRYIAIGVKGRQPATFIIRWDTDGCNSRCQLTQHGIPAETHPKTQPVPFQPIRHFQRCPCLCIPLLQDLVHSLSKQVLKSVSSVVSPGKLPRFPGHQIQLLVGQV